MPAAEDLASELVRRELDGNGVATLILNRPEHLNALSPQLIEELAEHLDQVAADSRCRVVILTGAGRAFCAGADLAAFEYGEESGTWSSPQARMRTQQQIASLITRLRSLPQPVVAAVNGPAVGGGLALALASDVRIGSTAARFGAAFVRVGLSGCDIGVSWLLPRLVGAATAFELMLTGRVIDAAEAQQAGLLSRIVEGDTLLEAAGRIAGEITRNSPMGVRMTKEVMWSQLEVGSLGAGIDLENRTQVMLTYSADQVEAAQAFLEKRAPKFENR